MVRQKSGPEEAIGHAIRVIRTEHGLSRKELAKRSGLSYPYLSEIEAGKKSPSSKALRAIANAVELPPHELLAAAETLATGPRSWANPARRSVFHESAAAMGPRAEPTDDFHMERLALSDAMIAPSLAPPDDDGTAELLGRFRELSEADRDLVLDFIRRLSQG